MRNRADIYALPVVQVGRKLKLSSIKPDLPSKTSMLSTLRGTYLRKHIATVTQLIGMSDGDLKLLAQFMGHSQLIHEQQYRKTDSTLQVARLSKLLMAFNEGEIERYEGQRLEDLDIHLHCDSLADRRGEEFIKNNSASVASIHDESSTLEHTCQSPVANNTSLVTGVYNVYF
ncbi:hypothetical protein CBL_21297 [Carabus blaptoides fortunei]